MKKVSLFALSLAFVGFMAACNNQASTEDTMEENVEELGEDMEDAAEDAGDAIEEGAEDTQDAMEEGAENVEESMEDAHDDHDHM